VIITYEGTEYDFSADRITVDEWRELKRKYKMTPGQFQEGLNDADPDAMTFLYVSMMRQAGRTNITLGDHIKPDIIALNQAIAASQEAEVAEAAELLANGGGPEPDPTKASPSLAASPGRGHQKASHSSEGSPHATE
jgi:hypothetical protein